MKSSTSIHRETAVPALLDYTGRGPRPRTLQYQDAPISVKELVTNDPDAFTEVQWRRGTRISLGNPPP